MTDSANIARHLGRMAALQPNTPALKIPRGRDAYGKIEYLTLSFAELEAEVDAWVAELNTAGVRPGDRVLVMVRQGLPLIAAAFALFKHGAVPVVIDPGMGLKSFLTCVERTQPRALLGIPLARVISRIFRRAFRSLEVRIAASGNPLARRTRGTESRAAARVDAIARKPKDLAAILFTSGSTGAPKGVCYEHGMFEAQVRLIRAMYDIQPGEIDLPMLPIFALFNPALGMTTVVPEIDPSRPAKVDPAKIVQAIQQEGVTNSFGSPTLWNKIADYCIQTKTTLPSLRRVLSAGAPVPAALWRKSKLFLVNGQLHSPYGATEALPVSTFPVAGLDPKARDQLGGTCVGQPAPEVQLKIIAISDGPIAKLSDARELPSGQIGEIIVAGPMVTQSYDALPEATAAAKIFGSDGRVWHRMGDCGYLDDQGCVWFCGRKVERVETSSGVLFTEPVEQVFREVAGVARCALIGLGAKPNQTPALVVQADSSRSENEKAELVRKLREAGRDNLNTRSITRFFFHPSFPVDVRHNAKIHRLTLAKWAANQTPMEIS